MKKNILFVFSALLLLATAVVSCSEDDNTVVEFPNWQETNIAYFNDVYAKAKANADGSWKVFKTWSKEDTIPGTPADYIAVKVLEEGTGSGCPMYTDSVRVHYRGRLVPSTSYEEGYVFEQTYSGEFNPKTCTPVNQYVASMIDGYVTALQQMHIGDRWLVYVPYQLAYGESEHMGIPAYSTLIFDISLVAYYRPGAKPNKVRAKKGMWIEE
ncbi:FKBP-type peptidyl-prolyl cis-trans isomerase [Prevotella sp. PCHR]|uniref:Peptidyl-prolyl cis-trans isomerase n=1 Tax=Xylanibacter caecicola TaxID=2736294 RepID=A0ABX2B213_9BACT|nr:FKBP-type peptidyl-prolyl cis-trans isomerase [Xylanibacter caecicola]NPE24848.1 FKBP-type peptidyl-prolyl cis-trans isomerase [Xylanibacter caecicola]